MPGLVDELQIHIFGHHFPVDGAVGKGLHQRAAGRGHGGDLRQQLVVIRRFIGKMCPPEREEHVRIAAGGGAFQADAAVLPVAETSHFIDVFIRQIHAAGVGDAAVHHHDLAVVAVIQHQIQHRHAAVETERPDAVGTQQIYIVVGQQAQAAGIVVDDTNVQAGGGFLPQDLVDLAPHLAHADDEAFHKNAVLRGLQVGQHIGQHHIAHGVIPDGGAAENRRSSVVLQVISGLGQARVAAGQLGAGGGVAGAQGRQLGLGTLHAAAQGDGRALIAPH